VIRLAAVTPRTRTARPDERESPHGNDQVRDARPPPQPVARVLAMQQSAGNAAVTQMLLRQPATATGPKEDLIAGRLADSGQYKPDGTGFADPRMQAFLVEAGALLGVDVSLPPGAAAPQSASPKQGDSLGRGLSDHPPWVARFQEELSKTQGVWTPEQRAAQRLVEAFLRAWSYGAVGNITSPQEFYAVAGAHENNPESLYVGGGNPDPQKDLKDWCGDASSSAVVTAMLRHGLRFKSLVASDSKRDALGTSRRSEIARQQSAFMRWINAENQGRKLWGKQTHTADLYPGDVIQFVGAWHQAGHTGHIATVVMAQSGRVILASGNAAGASVRVEETVREDPRVKGWNYDNKTSRDSIRPGASNGIYIFSIWRASILNIAIAVTRGLNLSDEDLGKIGLERAPKPLDELWPLEKETVEV
jgi:hypothetical protein